MTALAWPINGILDIVEKDNEMTSDRKRFMEG